MFGNNNVDTHNCSIRQAASRSKQLATALATSVERYMDNQWHTQGLSGYVI